MSSSIFKHYDLKLVQPDFNSSLTDLIIDLDFLRRRQLGGTTPAEVFFQLKHIFHTLESIGSARIEGNNTTIAEYMETKIDAHIPEYSPNIIEIQNIENAISFIEDTIMDNPINKAYVSQLHKIVVKDLAPAPEGEGDRTPGVYRTINPVISNSLHRPPDFTTVESYMQEMFEFIERNDGGKNDLLKAAIAHHRFVWIHPFSNGNGRTVRLFTYAMLVKTGFNLNVGRIINPTAVFCNDRNKYYNNLAIADTGEDKGILKWCEYVLSGLNVEIEKIDKLVDYEYLKSRILIPAIKDSLERQIITETESKILRKVVEKKVIQSSDLKDIFASKSVSLISKEIKKLIEKKMLRSENPNSRKYILRFDNNYLLRAIIKMLDINGFLPVKDN